MSGYRETADTSKYKKETNAGTVTVQTPTTYQGKEGREMNARNRRGNQSRRRT